MNAILLCLALTGPIDYQARWDLAVAAGMVEMEQGGTVVHLTAAGCDLHQSPPWVTTPTITGGSFCRELRVADLKPRRIARGILTAAYAVHGPVWRKYLQVRATLPDGREERFIFSPNSMARCRHFNPPRP